MEADRWLPSGPNLLCPTEAGSSLLLYGNQAAKASCHHAACESRAVRPGPRNQAHPADPVQRVGIVCQDVEGLSGTLGTGGHNASEHCVRKEAPVVREVHDEVGRSGRAQSVKLLDVGARCLVD
jgi:hypothetical protein